jgi:hypothetical protein
MRWTRLQRLILLEGVPRGGGSSKGLDKSLLDSHVHRGPRSLASIRPDCSNMLANVFPYQEQRRRLCPQIAWKKLADLPSTSVVASCPHHGWVPPALEPKLVNALSVLHVRTFEEFS